MADVWYRTGTFSTPASGTTVITWGGGVTNPKAIHLWWTNADTNDTNEAGQCYGHGFGDGVDALSMCIAAQDNGSVNRRHGIGAIGGTDNIIAILDPSSITTTTSGTLHVIGTTAAMNTSDVTISYSTFTANKIVHWEIWGGNDVTANLMNHNADAATDSPFTHGLSPEKPDLLLSCTLGQAHPANAQYSFLAFGAAHDSGAIDQWTHFAYLGDNDLDTQGSALAPAFQSGQYNIDFAAWDLTITAISTTTFTWTNTGSGLADDIMTLAIDLSGIGVDVGTFTKATGGAPASQDMPDLGFTPQGYHLSTSALTVVTTNVDRKTCVSHGAVDEDADVGHSCLATGTITVNTARQSRSNNAEVLQGAADLEGIGVDWSGTHQTIADSTPTIEWNPNTANADHIGYYAFETQAVAVLDIPDVHMAPQMPT